MPLRAKMPGRSPFRGPVERFPYKSMNANRQERRISPLAVESALKGIRRMAGEGSLAGESARPVEPNHMTRKLSREIAIDELAETKWIYEKKLMLEKEEIEIREMLFKALREINSWDELWRFMKENGITREIYDRIFHLDERKAIYGIFHPNEVVDQRRMEKRTPVH